MRHHRDRCCGNGTDMFCKFSSPFQFHGVCPAFLHQPSCIADSVINGRLIRHKRHICNYHGIFYTSCNRPCMMNHILHSHRQGIFISKHHHAQRISYQNHINSCLVYQLRHRIIISSEHGNFFSPLLCLLNCNNCILH